MPYPSGMCRAPQRLMKSATEVLFGKSDNCSKRLLTSQLDYRHPATVVGYVGLNEVRTSLMCEADSYRWVMTDGAEYMVNGGEAGRGSSSSVAVDRKVQWLWASWTVLCLRTVPGTTTLGRLGLLGCLSAGPGALGKVPWKSRMVLTEAVRRESGTDGKRHRYSLTGTALRAHLLWAEKGLGQRTPPGSRVLVAAGRTGIASV